MSKVLVVLVLVMILGLFGFAALFLAGSDVDSSTIGETSDSAKLDAILDRLDAIEERQSSTESEVGALRRSKDSAPVSIGPGQLDAAVERALARRMPGGDLPGGPETVAAATEEMVEEATGIDMAEAMRMLSDPDIKGGKRFELLAKLASEGKIDEVIAALKERAAEDAGNPDAHNELGEAYIAKIVGGKANMMEQGILSAAAHKAYDKALDLDPDHLRARLNKGANYFWSPPQLGLEGKALEQLEHAVRIQGGMEAQDDFADTHMMVGTLHQRMGNMDKAREAWQRGLDRHPNNKQLRDKLKN